MKAWNSAASIGSLDSHRQMHGPSAASGKKLWLWKPRPLCFSAIAPKSSGLRPAIHFQKPSAAPALNSWYTQKKPPVVGIVGVAAAGAASAPKKEVGVTAPGRTL